jgi:hypothetical protein
MSERVLYEPLGTDYRGRVFSGNFTITAAGAVLTQTLGALSGVVVTKLAAAGRYLVTPYKGMKTFKAGVANVEGPATAASGGPTTGESGTPMLRSAGAGAFTIQLRRADTLADADATSGTKVHWMADLSEGP